MEFKKLSDVDSVEELHDEDSILIESNGEIKKVTANAVGGAGLIVVLPEQSVDEE